MCIRDSAERVQGDNDHQSRIQTHGHFAVECGRSVNQRRDVCLLYTSDAADERSSVDLGGRRIIKKKTNR